MNLDNRQGFRGRDGGPMHTAQGYNQPQLFDDTSMQPPPTQMHPGMSHPMQGGPPQAQYGGQPQQPPQGQGQFYSPQQFMSDPMASMAMSYGQTLADQGKDMVQKNLEKYVSTSKLKYYFAIDTSYVGKKLGLLAFPYMHKDWSIRYDQDVPVTPKFDVNAPDLYIPVMAFVTYILMAGLMYGTQSRFSPEQLGMTASTALVWMIIEIVVLLLTTYILRLTTALNYLDLLAYCGYKYFGMLLVLIGGLLFQSTGYYAALGWTSAAIAYFLVRSLKFAIIPHMETDSSHSSGNKRRFYMLLVIALTQPVFMWWLTRSIAFYSKSI